jgi:N-acetylglucosamine kinase-like BadF-type ATPase
VALGAQDFDELIVRVNQSPAPDFAALFPVVLAAANSGDHAAGEILARAGCELAELAGNVIGRLLVNSEISVALHGGVLESSPTVVAAFRQHMKRSFPQGVVRSEAIDAARGAWKRARRNSANL